MSDSNSSTTGARPTLGMIGVGRMGAEMAGRLLAAGHAVVVCDPSPAAVAAMHALGATVAGSPRELADRCDIAFASVPTPDIVHAVALGNDGVVHGKRARLFVDLSTTGPDMSRTVADALAAAGGPVMVDCPVSGGVAGARKGTLTMMVAGPRDAIDTIDPLLAILGKVYRCGERPGQFQIVKLDYNMVSVAAMAVSCEALVLCAAAGVDPKVMVDVINVSSGRNGATMDKLPKHILPRSFDFGFSTALSQKDLRLCLEQARELGVPMLMGTAVGQVLALSAATFGADADFTIMSRLIEQWAGVEVPQVPRPA